MSAVEINFDGLIGPTHNYGGLSYGNLASSNNANLISNPREAALQGLLKMKTVRNLGLTQGVLPPHQRPHLPTLQKLGFRGGDKEMIMAAMDMAPEVLKNVYAASPMWTANAGTVSPSADTADGRVHFTPANLTAMFHRAIEVETTGKVLKTIFSNEKYFAHHGALPGGAHFGDEGAANHNRFCNEYGNNGFEVFVFGQRALGEGAKPQKFPARQSFEASEAVARLHGLNPSSTCFIQQNPAAIDAGVFHNDVVAVSNRNVFFYHQEAYVEPHEMQTLLKRMAPELNLQFIEVPSSEVPLGDAIKSYLFNSQLISPKGANGMTLILPLEAQEVANTKAYLERLQALDTAIENVKFLDVRQSMRNGGGPACLRLRVVLTKAEQGALGANVILTDALFEELSGWVKTHYRDRLSPDDLGDPDLMDESFRALDELTQVLRLGSIYPFQT